MVMIIDNPIKDNPASGKFQEGAAPAITDNPRLGRMTAEMTGAPARPATGGRPVMMAANAEIRPQAPAPGARVMEKPPENPQGSTPATASGDMKARPQLAEPAAQGYLRLRVRVTDGRMRIVSAQTVDGPLALSPSFVGQHAYEVMLDARPIALEGLPDFGVSRSYPRPDQHEHHITARPTYEFNVRVPRSLLPGDALGRLHVTLFRFPDASPKTALASVARQFGQQASVVAAIEGVREEHLEAPALEHLKKLFPSSFQSPR
jgi:hypothetical protein